MNLTNYIIFHNEESLQWFIQHNADIWHKFKFILVGDKDAELTGVDIIRATDYPNNIECYPSLLTFTAWYLIANNYICKTEYVGLFEYDVIFKEYPEPNLREDTIYGFVKRELPDKDNNYLEAIPDLINEHLYPNEVIKANSQPFWNATTNFIVIMPFLKLFVNWYYDLIMDHDLLRHKKVSHYHERMVNFWAANNHVKNEHLDILEHKELNSHGVRL